MGRVSVTSAAATAELENEDAVALGEGIGVVVDGAGLPAALRAGCRHTVAWYAGSLAAAFRDRLQRRDGSMRDALAGAITGVTDSHRDECRLAEGSPSATVAAWRLTATSVEYLVLCDASIVLALRDGTIEEVTDDRLAALTAPVRDPDRAPGVQAAVRAEVERSRNRPGGFWCAHTDPAAADEALHGQVELEAVRAVVAASDGATRGHQLLGVLNLDDLADAVMADDAARVVRAIRRAEDADDSLAARAIKQHDDATLVAVVLDEPAARPS